MLIGYDYFTMHQLIYKSELVNATQTIRQMLIGYEVPISKIRLNRMLMRHLAADRRNSDSLDPVETTPSGRLIS